MVFSACVSRAVLPTRKRHVTGLPASPTGDTGRFWARGRGTRRGCQPLPWAQPSSPCAARRSSRAASLPQLGSPLHRTNASTPRDFYLIFSSSADASGLEAAAQEHLPLGWGLLPSPQQSFQPTALHIKYHQIIYSRCQLQATAKEKVYLRYHVDCYTRS